jgi:hypothetical protein
MLGAVTYFAFLAAFSKLWKATINFIMPVRLYVRMEHSRLPPEGFLLFYIRVFSKLYLEGSISLKSDKNNCYFTWRHVYIYDNISLNSS